MAKNIWSVLCSRSIIDSNTSQVSLIDIVERIELRAPPQNNDKLPENIILPMHYVSFWTREEHDTPETGTFRIFIEGPNKNKSEPQEFPIELSESRNQRFIVDIGAIKFYGFGDYKIILQQKHTKGKKDSWRKAAETPFDVVETTTV